MKIFEVIEQDDELADQPANASIPTQTSTPVAKKPVPTPVAKPARRAVKGAGPFVFDNIKYANKAEQQPIVAQIEQILKPSFPAVNVRNDVEDINAGKRIPSIRILNALPRDKVLELLSANGFNLTQTANPVQIVSGTYQGFIYTFTVNNIVFTVVIAGKGAKEGEEGKCQVGIQMLRPEKFGLKGVDLTKTEMVNTVKTNLPNVVKSDPQLQDALSQLLDVAVGTRSAVDPELMAHIAPCLNLISQDFGEILTPIVLADSDNDIISFSATSNKPLIDVEINGTPVAVKSLGGSGNSFAAISKMIDEYEQSMLQDDPKWKANKHFDILKDFVSKNGKTNDKLIRAAQNAAVPEAITLNKILGTTPMSYPEMEAAVTKLLVRLNKTAAGKQNLYSAYLKTIMPAAVSAGRTRGKKKTIVAVGLPGDYRQYVHDVTPGKEQKQSTKSAGKKKFDANFVRAASRQLTYMLGMGFRNAVVEGDDAQEMEQTITNIMTRKDAVAAKITIAADGSIKVVKVPFKDLKFGYQYHAGTDTVDQNAPGFHIQFI
ncbi:hypothetical protein UFOVP181_124 [uncultured Caudovirales phage]|uniref:Uncharacterized protein n=1 Tax=uncultured Caudovirales phage TaxID=2100421 RepID=A0A6J5KV71_9CAUD|nr:hypothetical protein UFOVP57_38 [uncultured Caudovirales phage]CAB5208702.1 hypothetical protein UFOVP181_124 [uncultured Caudovirales phage]